MAYFLYLLKNHSMYNKLIICGVLFANLLFWASCENNMEEVKAVSEQFETTVETIEEVKMLYSESANIRVELRAPKLLRHKTKNPFLEFPEGLQLTFFDDSLQVNSVLSANYGIRYEKEQRTIVRDKVVWLNENKNEKLETEELLWNERARKILSDKFVKITTDTESIFGEGFEAEQDFSSYKIKKITGTVRVNADEFNEE
jgi:LPS export ABC transporter protein LptC